MSAPDDEYAQLAARNAAMRSQVDDMMADLRRRTEELKEAQERMAQLTGEASSADGIVTAQVDRTGLLTSLTLSSRAFDRGTPEQLAAEITRVVRKAAASVRVEVTREVQALTPGEDMVDLPDLVPGAPSLRELFKVDLPEEDEEEPEGDVADDDYYANQKMWNRDEPQRPNEW
ncbi:YbaB/EbfC family nucleoid-associated protein [Actinocrispum sp. NPDC049592]|uniref:YbaB/EbfC family nucleoid-associated protein n=1 Tax=Actinocrispum sp. NPDC049592 TaxID=3154835 RepID=UPI003436C196